MQGFIAVVIFAFVQLIRRRRGKAEGMRVLKSQPWTSFWSRSLKRIWNSDYICLRYSLSLSLSKREEKFPPGFNFLVLATWQKLNTRTFLTRKKDTRKFLDLRYAHNIVYLYIYISIHLSIYYIWMSSFSIKGSCEGNEGLVWVYHDSQTSRWTSSSWKVLYMYTSVYHELSQLYEKMWSIYFEANT